LPFSVGAPIYRRSGKQGFVRELPEVGDVPKSPLAKKGSLMPVGTNLKIDFGL
jgi:hypothetical protein